MDEDRKVVDLSPMEYEVKEGKRKEPFLARGWYWGAAALIAIYAVAYAFIGLRQTLTQLLH